MIIYKYVNVKDINMILDSQRIAFSHPRDFNDPFDRPRVSRQPYGYQYYNLFDGRLMTREAQAEEADAAWNQCFVSSFTRTPDNALMWAHYADKHTGVVIEIDADRAGLTSKEILIPVQFGSVIYMKRPIPDIGHEGGLPVTHEQVIKRGDTRFDIENYAGLQRLFLTKALAWAYEEEIRAVCEPYPYVLSENGESWDGTWKPHTKENGQELYLFRLKPGSITRIFAGLRYKYLNELRDKSHEHGFEIMVATDKTTNGYDVQFLNDKIHD